MKREFRIGSRESRLAVLQAEQLRAYLSTACPALETTLVTMKTTGDRILDRPLEAVGGKGLFVKELDLALLEGRTDCSVHSLKDLPMEVPESLPVWGFSRREDPRDALCLPLGQTEWDRSKPVGCASRRRAIQLRRRYPGIEIRMIRGNVPTRLRKLDEGGFGAVILAAAGLRRLGLEDRITRCFSEEEMIPAAGQGILAVQGRAGEDFSFLTGFFDAEAAACALAERAFVRVLNGGCTSPIAAHAVLRDGTLCLTGLNCPEGSEDYWTDSISGAPEDAAALGEALAGRMKGEEPR